MTTTEERNQRAMLYFGKKYSKLTKREKSQVNKGGEFYRKRY